MQLTWLRFRISLPPHRNSVRYILLHNTHFCFDEDNQRCVSNILNAKLNVELTWLIWTLWRKSWLFPKSRRPWTRLTAEPGAHTSRRLGHLEASCDVVVFWSCDRALILSWRTRANVSPFKQSLGFIISAKRAYKHSNMEVNSPDCEIMETEAFFLPQSKTLHAQMIKRNSSFYR